MQPVTPSRFIVAAAVLLCCSSAVATNEVNLVNRGERPLLVVRSIHLDHRSMQPVAMLEVPIKKFLRGRVGSTDITSTEVIRVQ